MSDQAHTSHHSPVPYMLTLGALLALTVITVAAAQVNFGTPAINVIIALFIATVKATLVALFFMHLRHDKPINAIIFVSSLVFLGVFLSLCMIDVNSRDRVYPYGLRQQDVPPAGQKAGQKDVVVPGGQAAADRAGQNEPNAPAEKKEGSAPSSR